jgi:hypothetical protein
MDLAQYFNNDDGVFPEINVTFTNPTQVKLAFEHLFAHGARDATVNGGLLLFTESQKEELFSDAQDAVLMVITGKADSFRIVLAGVIGADCPIPDLGVFVSANSLVFDYREGTHWGQTEIHSILTLLRQLREFGGVVSIPWFSFGNGERDLLDAINNV